MAASKKRSYTARDYEDMVKIELDDAIEAERKKTNNLVGILDEEWNRLTRDHIIDENQKKNKVQVNPDISDIGVRYKGKNYTKAYFRLHSGESTHTLQESTTNFHAVIHIDLLGGGKPAAQKLVETLLQRAKDIAKACKIINGLEAKRRDYSNLAARFRLGYTGDPTDLDSINKKCKEYLLKGTI